MATITAEERLAFRDQVRRLLADRSGEAQVRAAMETPQGYDPVLWRELADLGIVGLIVEEVWGGAGAGPMELELVMEEAGAALLCSPLLSSGVLAAGLLQALDDGEAKARLLPRIADGSLIATAALTGQAATWTPQDVAVTASPSDGGAWRLDGKAAFVTHAQIADVLLVAARAGDGLAIFEVDPKAQGVTVAPLPTFDHTLRLADVDFQGAAGRRLSGPADAWSAVEASLDLVRVALAGEQAGAGAKVLAFTVDYAKARIQFGRPIGGFQAIKHMAADLLLDSESAVSAARHAARALAEGAPGAGSDISLAAFACAEAFTTIAATAIQMHGGVAFTWAHPAHLYLRRARADAQLFGTPAFYRERFIRQLGG